MKRLMVFIIMVQLFGCNSEESWDCIQTVGEPVVKDFQMDPFRGIQIENDVSLLLKQGSEQKVVVETGENLLDDLSIYVEDEILIIRNNNTCNLVRDYDRVKATVTVTNLDYIRNSSVNDVRGEGVLNFPELALISNTTSGPEIFRKSGDFYLQLNCNKFRVSANGQSIFYVNGRAANAQLVFSDEFPRFEGANFIIDTLQIRQRSANKMIVNPIEEITGKIQGTGDVISVNRPPIINVEELYTGRLIFQD